MQRTKFHMWDIVEDAIVLADKGMTQEAAHFCKSNNVPIDVAFRVISKPTKRRKYKTLVQDVWGDVNES